MKKLVLLIMVAGVLGIFTLKLFRENGEIQEQESSRFITTDSSSGGASTIAKNDEERTPASTGTPHLPKENSSVEKRLKTLLDRYKTKDFSFDRNASTGQIIAITGGLLDLDHSQKTSPEDFAKLLAEALGVPGKEIRTVPEQLGSSALTEVTSFHQTIGDYEVMDSMIKLHRSKQSGLIYYINTEVFSVPPDWKPELVYSSESIYNKLLPNLKNENVQINVHEHPLIYALDARQIELVWPVDIISKGDGSVAKERRLFVGAVSGQIRVEVPLHSH